MKHLRNFHRTKIGIIFLSFVGFILTLSLILFTPWGNRLITPIVEKSLSSGFSTPMSLQEFSLSHNRFHLMAQDTFGNTLSTQGGFSLLTLRLYAHYRVECFNGKGMNPISVPLKTTGALSGGMASFIIQGDTDIFNGDILYKIELHRFHLASLDLTINQIRYEKLMHYLEYPSNTDTLLNGTVDLRGFDRRDVMGKINLTTQTRRLHPTPIKEDDNSSFDLKTFLTDKYGRIKPFHISINLNASLAHAGILEQFVGIPLSGELRAKGILEGDEKQLQLHAKSDVARGDAKFTILFPDFEPSSIMFDIRGADAKQTFELFALPAPVSGRITAYADLNASSGRFYISLKQASTLPKVLKRHYGITQPSIGFDADIHADLTPKWVHYRIAFASDLTRLEIDNSTTHDQMLRELLSTIPKNRN